MQSFPSQYGFERNEVGLHNWRERPYSQWSFFNVSELVPTAIARSALTENVNIDPHRSPSIDNSVFDIKLNSGSGTQTLKDFLIHSETDMFLLWRDGKMICEYAAPHASAKKPHIIFSISKSISGILAGILEDHGILDTNKSIRYYLPETRDGGFADCSVRNLLDMRVSLNFSEEYLNQDGDYARYRRSTLWNPALEGKKSENLVELLYNLQKGKAQHGGPFHYLSPASDMLGILIEKVSSQRYCDFLSNQVLVPMGASTDAHMTVDTKGTPRGAGGISITSHDLLSIGKMLLEDGALNGKQIISPHWVEDMRTGGNDEAWAKGNFGSFIPNGRYRSKWYQMPRNMDAFLAIGIHGQWLYVDRPTRSIFVKLSSQTIPQNDILDEATLLVFQELAHFQL